MAIVDAYIYANMLANSLVDNKYSVPKAVTLCDPNFRRKANEQSIKEARFYCDVTHWSGFFVCKFWGLAYKFAPKKNLYSAIFGNTEYSNKEYWEYYESLHTKKSSNKASHKAPSSCGSFLLFMKKK